MTSPHLQVISRRVTDRLRLRLQAAREHFQHLVPARQRVRRHERQQLCGVRREPPGHGPDRLEARNPEDGARESLLARDTLEVVGARERVHRQDLQHARQPVVAPRVARQLGELEGHRLRPVERQQAVSV